MIIFTTIKNIPYELLEYKGIRQVVSYNLSSYYSDVPTMNALIPNIQHMSEELLQGDCVIPQFDIEFGNYIINTNEAFLQFMNIVIPAYMNPDMLVQILIGHSDFRDAITESLIKLIQQRYGYNSYIVNDIEDFLCVDESDFSIPGLFAIDEDINKWRALVGPQAGDIYEY